MGQLRRENALLRDRVTALEADKAELRADLERERKEHRTERDETGENREDLLREAAERGVYAKLYRKLRSLPETQREWRTSLPEIDHIISPHRLPRSARLYRPWWANDTKGGHTQALAWVMAGWLTSRVNLTDETLIFIRKVNS
jgi:hypothetical protein